MAKRQKRVSNRIKNRLALQEKASKGGWSFGRSMLSIPLDSAYQALRQAGLKVYADEDCIFGVMNETRQAMEILASHGDKLSIALLTSGDNYASPR